MKTIKTNFYVCEFCKKYACMLVLTLGVACLMSCSKSNDDGDKSNGNDNSSDKTEWTLGLNTDGNLPYDMMLFDNTRGNVSMIQLDNSGKPERMDIISNTAKNMMTVMYNEEGLVKSIGIDEMTIALSNYNGNKADIAYIYNNNFYVAQEVEFDVNWDEVKQMATYDEEESTAAAVPRRSFSSTFFSTFEAADKWLRNHEDTFKKLFFATDEIIHGKNVFQDAMTMDLATLDKLADIKDELKDMTKDYAEFEVDKHLGGEVWQWDAYTLIKDAKEAYEHFRKANLLTVEYDALKALLTNYEAYSDFCEESWYDIIEFVDSWNKPNTELGEGALNSGMGDLKATLTWSFYADIDLHAYEPGNTHIYFNNERSRVTGGYLDVDNRAGGSGAIENIYWESPVEGQYRFYIDYYGASTYNGAEESGNCKVTIMYKGKGNVYNINMAPDNEMVVVASVSLPEGAYTRSFFNDDIKVDFKKEPKGKQ